MKPFRFIHSADWHLDAPFKGMGNLPPAVLSRIRDSSFRALEALVGLAIREKVDFMLVSGDIYDAQDRSLRAQLKFQQAAWRLADHGIPLFVVHGNHDPLQGYRAKLAMPDSVVVFGGDRVETVLVKGKDGEPIASVSGISYARPAVTDNLAERFPAPDRSLFSIAMLHTNVDGDAGHDNYAPADSRELLASGYRYWALGHVHNRKVIHESPWIVYPGNLQGRNVRETGAKGAYLVEVDADGEARLQFCPLHAVRWEQLRVSIEGLEDEQALKDAMERALVEAVETEPDVPVVARLILEGRGRLHRLLQGGSALAELTDLLREQYGSPSSAGLAWPEGTFAWIESVKLATGSDWDYDALRKQESFLGDLVRMTDEWLGDETELRAFFEEAAASLLANPKVARRLNAPDAEDLKAWMAQARELALAQLTDGEERP